MVDDLAPNWRKNVYMLLWEDVDVSCQRCLRRALCHFKAARLTDGREMRQWLCAACAPQGAGAVLLSADDLRAERALLGDGPLRRLAPAMVSRMLTPAQKRTLRTHEAGPMAPEQKVQLRRSESRFFPPFARPAARPRSLGERLLAMVGRFLGGGRLR